MKLQRAVLFGLTALVLLCCREPAPTPVFAAGTLGSSAPDLLPLKKSGFSLAWLRPEVSFASYDAVRLVYPAIKYRTPPRHSSSDVFGRDNYSLPDDLARDFLSALEQSFRSQMTTASGWRPAAQPGGAGAGRGSIQTLEIQVSLVDLIVHVPLRQLAGDTHAWISSIGEVTVVIDLYDAPGRRMIGRFAERQPIARVSGRAIKADAGSSLYEARRIFLRWARNLRGVLEAKEAAYVTAAPHATPASVFH